MSERTAEQERADVVAMLRTEAEKYEARARVAGAAQYRHEIRADLCETLAHLFDKGAHVGAARADTQWREYLDIAKGNNT